MKPPLPLAAAGLALVAPLACAAVSPQSPSLDREFDLRAGASARLEGTDLVVRFEGVPNDSRCPVDVQCITAGDATVALRLTGGGAGASTYELHTLDGPKQARHSSYVVVLIGLAPRPVSTRTIPPGDYVATVLVGRTD
jgi:hypothetical protein